MAQESNYCANSAEIVDDNYHTVRDVVYLREEKQAPKPIQPIQRQPIQRQPIQPIQPIQRRSLRDDEREAAPERLSPDEIQRQIKQIQDVYIPREVKNPQLPQHEWCISQFKTVEEVKLDIFCNVLSIEFTEDVLKTGKKNVDKIVKVIPALFFTDNLTNKVLSSDCSIFVKRFSKNGTMLEAIRRCANLFFNKNGVLYRWWNGSSLNEETKDIKLTNQRVFLRYSSRIHQIKDEHELPTILTFMYSRGVNSRKLLCYIVEGKLSFYNYHANSSTYSEYSFETSDKQKLNTQSLNDLFAQKIKQDIDDKSNSKIMSDTDKQNTNKTHPDVDNILRYVLIENFEGDVPELMGKQDIDSYYVARITVYDELQIEQD